MPSRSDWHWIDDPHEEKLARTWKPDPTGLHDDLTEHPYTGFPGRILLNYDRLGRSRRSWTYSPQNHT